MSDKSLLRGRLGTLSKSNKLIDWIGRSNSLHQQSRDTCLNHVKQFTEGKNDERKFEICTATYKESNLNDKLTNNLEIKFHSIVTTHDFTT